MVLGDQHSGRRFQRTRQWSVTGLLERPSGFHSQSEGTGPYCALVLKNKYARAILRIGRHAGRARKGKRESLCQILAYEISPDAHDLEPRA